MAVSLTMEFLPVSKALIPWINLLMPDFLQSSIYHLTRVPMICLISISATRMMLNLKETGAEAQSSLDISTVQISEPLPSNPEALRCASDYHNLSSCSQQRRHTSTTAMTGFTASDVDCNR